MRNVAWIIKKSGSAIKVTFTSGWPWVKETASGKILTDGCSGTNNGFITLEPTDEIVMLQNGGEFTPAGTVFGEVRIGG